MNVKTESHQLLAWLNGVSAHNTETDECCPDYSCCRRGLKASAMERKRYYFYPHLRPSMNFTFTERLINFEVEGIEDYRQ